MLARSLATAVARSGRSRALVAGRADESAWWRDWTLIAGSLVLTAVAQPHLFAATTPVSLDSASQFFPWYAYLGAGLRSGHVLGWNPAVFSGTPFAANPLSGWTYLPAMVLFTLLPLAEAARVYLLIHPALAGVGVFALARVLGIGRAGALLASVAYANTAFFQIQNACCFAFASVYSWVPLALLGAELAMRSVRWQVRAAWWGLAALAFAQILAAWLGQGAYYAALLLGGYIAYRTLLLPSDEVATARWTARLSNFVLHVAGVFALAALLDAAALLPRLEFNALSSLAGGYTGAEAMVGGLNPKDWVLPATPGFWYAGGSVLALACAAPLLVRGRRAKTVWFFGLASVLALLLSGTVETPLHWLLYHALPGFARLHPHAPERILTVAYLGPALLAGAAAGAVLERQPWRRLAGGRHLSPSVAAGLLVLIVTADLTLGGAKARDDWRLQDRLNGADKLIPVDLSTWYLPDAAASFLRQRLAEEPSRYIGYDPYLDGEPWPYSTRFMEPATAPLLVDNRALLLGLQDVQGYDASHLGDYDKFIARLNGRTQNYHDAEIFRSGLGSPLFDLLNVRYVIVPVRSALDPFDTLALARFSTVAYQDAHVRILENASALPRAWLVHAAEQVTPEDALSKIANREVDARQAVLVEDTPPPIEPPANAANDRAAITVYEADRIALITSSDAPGLLVLSEVAYPAWTASVDDRPARIYVADGSLRAVPVPAGQHTVELRFTSTTLRIGMIVSSITAVLLIGTVMCAVAHKLLL